MIRFLVTEILSFQHYLEHARLAILFFLKIAVISEFFLAGFKFDSKG